MGNRKLAERKAYMRLIRAYRDLPFLWNKQLPEHFNRELRQQTMEQLAEILRPIISNADGKFVAQKINNFRCSYVREYRKREQRKKAGVNYVPLHWAYHEMLFLEDVLKPTDQPSDDEESPTPKITAPKVSAPLPQFQPSVPELPPLLPLVPPAHSTAGVRTAISTNTSQGSDQCNTFIQLITIKLKELDPVQRLIVEKIINDTLFYAEIGELTFDQLSCIENTLKNRQKT